MRGLRQSERQEVRPRSRSLVLRQLWPKIKVPIDCWEWSGSVTNDGYAKGLLENSICQKCGERKSP